MKNKPPIGTAPYFIVIPGRIMELSQAITRYTEGAKVGTDKEVTKAIKEWANEIICHCETMDKMMERSEENEKNK